MQYQRKMKKVNIRMIISGGGVADILVSVIPNSRTGKSQNVKLVEGGSRHSVQYKKFKKVNLIMIISGGGGGSRHSVQYKKFKKVNLIMIISGEGGVKSLSMAPEVGYDFKN